MRGFASGATLGALLAAVAVVGCTGPKEGSNAGDTTAAASPAATAGTPAGSTATAGSTSGATTADTAHLSDANILAEEKGGDSSEVVIATYMRTNAASAPVRNYADTLLKDHTAALHQTESLIRAVSITPQEPPNDTTAQKTTHTLARLRSLSGAARDTAFVNGEIADHQHDIAEAHTMAASAQNARVKALVEQSLPVLQKHLDMAQRLAQK